MRAGRYWAAVTLRLAGDDVDIGGHFDLWPEAGAGEGVITCLFV